MVTYNEVLHLVKQLPDTEKARLIQEISTLLDNQQTNGDGERTPKKSLLGIWEGVSISEEDIDEVRREMWENFPREDI